jgi:hypothetical protein
MMGSAIFNSLSPQLQQRIDRAFNQAVQFQPEGSKDRHVQRDPIQSSGGFLVEEDKPEPNGGASQQPELQLQILLSSIPSALQRLDLPPDDEQVLSVFRNAASGWTSSNDIVDGKTGDGMVSRDDWRSVCAVLFEHHEEEYADDSEIGPMDLDRLHESDGEIESEDQLFASGDTDDGSDDEYVESPAALSSRRRTHTWQAKNNPISFSPSSSPSLRQQQTCLEAFALFFPSVPLSKVATQRIMIKDIQRVSKLLGEKIKANEVRFIFPSLKLSITSEVCSPLRPLL